MPPDYSMFQDLQRRPIFATLQLQGEIGFQLRSDAMRTYVNEFRGTSADDILDGTDLSDEIRGRGGNDILNGLGGDDKLRGGKGDDTLNGGDGDDILRGGKGSDTLRGDDGDDRLAGGEGDDFLIGGDGIDTVVFQGAFADYDISQTGDLTFILSRPNADGIGREVDFVNEVEFFKFSDQKLSVYDILPNLRDPDFAVAPPVLDSLERAPLEPTTIEWTVTNDGFDLDPFEIVTSVVLSTTPSNDGTIQEVFAFTEPTTALIDWPVEQDQQSFSIDLDLPSAPGTYFLSTVVEVVKADDNDLSNNQSDWIEVVVTAPEGVPTEGNDVLRTTDGPDTIDALGGDDIIIASFGPDIIDGGDGFDTLDLREVDAFADFFPFEDALYLQFSGSPVFVDFDATPQTSNRSSPATLASS